MKGLVDSGSGSTALEISLFGPTQLLIDGAAADLGRRQVRGLVAVLGVRNQRVVPSDMLIEHLWPAQLPAHPRKALNVALSRLRSALAHQAERLTSDHDGYRLDVDRCDIDDFTALVELGRTSDRPAAVDAFESALACWIGEPFADEHEATLLETRRESLSELRLFAVARLTELYGEIGDHERAAAISSPFLDDEVVRERLVVGHVLALAKSGRKSEALAATSRAIDALRTQHGLDPSRALLDAQRDILAGTADLGTRPTRQRKSELHHFVGRSTELDLLAATEAGCCVVLVGDAGSGKTALLDQFQSLRTASGHNDLRIDVSAMPDRPLDAVARLCLSRVHSIGGDNVSAEFSGTLKRLCPELDFDSAGVPTREAMIDDVVRFLEATTSSAVIVDDAHWLDVGSAEVFEQLVRRDRMLLVFGSRRTDNPRLAFLMDVAHGGAKNCSYVGMSPLTSPEIAALAATMSQRSLSPDQIDRLVERTGGNALFLRLLLERWADGGDLDGDLPASVLVSVSEHLDLLARPTLDTLSVASAVGRVFAIGALRGLRPNADSDLDAAEDAGLVLVDRTTDRATFVHSLVADVCYDLLATGRRVSIHEEIGRSLEASGASAAEYARHYDVAAMLDPRRAVAAYMSAVGDFASAFDWTTASTYVARALVLVADFGIDDLDLQAEIAVRKGTIGRALVRDGYADDLVNGCELARTADQPELFVHAVVELCGHGHSSVAGNLDQQVERLLEEALELNVDRALRAELCAAAAALFSMSNEVGRGRSLFHEAWAIVAALGNPDVEAVVVAKAHLGFAHPDDFELLVEASARMVALAGSDADLIWESAFVRFQCAVVRGDPIAAAEAIDVMRLYTVEVQQRPRDFGLAFSESAFACLSGDLDAAENFASQALDIGTGRFDPSWAMTIYSLLLLGIRMEQGRVSELAPALESVLRESPDYLPFRSVAAMIAAESGDVARARRELDVISVDQFGHIERDLHFTAVVTLLGAPVAAVGRSDEIEALESILLPFQGRMSWNGASSSGSVDHALALLAEARGDSAASKRYEASGDALVGSFKAGSEAAASVHNASS